MLKDTERLFGGSYGGYMLISCTVGVYIVISETVGGNILISWLIR